MLQMDTSGYALQRYTYMHVCVCMLTSVITFSKARCLIVFGWLIDLSNCMF